ncbi:YhdP family protein [Sedimenticola sp.]|uniref:YhdP family phospholipid transporter n=1 Tax=Sedimenticola sp. TaxID=1940285 RepID=UPI003D13C1C5
MKRLYHFSVRTVRRSLILLIILGGLLVVSGRLLAPLAKEYRTEVANWASELLGQPVEVGRLRGNWRGLGPELILYDMRLFDPRSHKPTLYLKEVRITLGLIDSLRQLNPVVRKVAFVSPRLRVIRRPNGAITIGNLDELAELNQSDGSSAFLLPTHLSLEKGEVIWEDQTVNVPPLRLTDVDLNLHNGGSRHQLNGSISLPGEQSGKLELAIDLRGQLNQVDSWSARSYMRSSGIDLAFLLNRRVADTYRFSNRQADIELWGEWDHDGLINLEGTTEWEQVAITRQTANQEQGSNTLGLDRASGTLRIQRQPAGWQLDLVNLLVQRNGQNWPQSQIGLIAQRDPQGHWRLRGGSSRLRLEDIHAISTLFPLPDRNIEQMLKRVEANGSLNNLRIDMRQTEDGTNWSASGEITDFTSKPWQGLPGVHNLPLAFWMDDRHGTLSVDGDEVSVTFADLFRDPLILKRVQGDLSWQRQQNGDLAIASERLLAENDDIHSLSRLRMTLPKSDQEPLFLDLQSDFWDGDATTTHKYLPTGIMSKDVVAWLDRSIGTGHVTEGSVLVRGPLSDFPFEKRPSGRFEVFFNVEDLHLDYWPEWPALNKVRADVRFLNNSFDTWVSGGEILDSRLTAAHARIDELARTSPLELNGSVEGPFNDTLRLLRESPLKHDFASLVKGLEGEGESQLEIAFKLPVDDGSPFKLDGRLQFMDSTLHLAPWQISLNDIRGDLQFDQDHIYATGISGKAFDLPIKVDVSTPKTNSHATRISATGNVPVSTLQKQFPALEQAAFVTGSSRWTLDLDIPHIAAGPNAPVPLRAHSDLVGVRIDQPAPFGKKPQAVRPLLLETRIDNKPVQQLHIRYDEQLDMALAVDRSHPEQPRLTRGGIVLGGERATLPQKPGIELTGRLKRLQLKPWVDRLQTQSGDITLPPLNHVSLTIDQLEIGEQKTDQVSLDLDRGDTHWEGNLVSDWADGAVRIPVKISPPGVVSAKLKKLRLDPWLELLGNHTTATDTVPLERLILTADQLSFKQASVDAFNLDLAQQNQSWQGRFSSSRFDGEITIPQQLPQAPIKLTLNRLDLSLDDSLFSHPQRSPAQPHEPLDPNRIPALEAEAKEVIINGKPFGTLQLITQHRGNSLALQTLSLNSERLQLSATGNWQADTALSSQSQLDISLSSRELGSVLSDLKLSNNIDGAPVEIDSRLNWQGSPIDFSTRLLSGQLSMQIGKGRFLKVDPGVGRLFGLFNLGALRRRLTLDFSDIFKKGFTYDSIAGNFILDTGDAFTNDFRMKGPSANIELSGRIGLGDEDFDALVTITPKISSSIPLAGAIAGGPAVGAALFLAQQLVGDSIDRVTRLEYMATGSWDDPVLTPKTGNNPEGTSQALEQNKSDTAENEPTTTPSTDSQNNRSKTQPSPSTPNPAASPSEQDKPSGFFSRLLDKIKPTGPAYPETAPDKP